MARGLSSDKLRCGRDAVRPGAAQQVHASGVADAVDLVVEQAPGMLIEARVHLDERANHRQRVRIQRR